MKTTILLVFSILLITRSLVGQIEKFKYVDSEIKRDFSLSNNLYNKLQIDTNFKVPGIFDLRNLQKSHRFDMNQDSSFRDYLKIKRFPEHYAIIEEYPGSSRFYGNIFCIKPDTTGKLFIKRPDTSNKYYLIINDPVRHTINK